MFFIYLLENKHKNLIFMTYQDNVACSEIMEQALIKIKHRVLNITGFKLKENNTKL